MHGDLDAVARMGFIFAAAVVLALGFSRLRLPPVLGYLLAGLVLGPDVLALVDREHGVEVMAEIGVTLLLFTIGLEFSVGELLRSWRAVLLAGTLQVGLTTLLVSGIALAWGRPPGAALAWGFLLALSSTAVILRLLDARGETRAPHGRLAIGVLIFQDLCIVPMMLLLPLLGDAPGEAASAGGVALRAAAVVLGTLLLGRFVAPPLFTVVARERDREIFLLAVLAVAALVAMLTALSGLSLALGAFLAGMVLADTRFAHQALADVLPLRTVTMCVFFVSIGMLVDLRVLVEHPITVLAAVVATLVLKSQVALLVGLLLRFPVPVAATAALALAQVGEFSLVLAGEAHRVGLIAADERQLFLISAVLTIAIAPVVVSLSPRLVAGTPGLAPLERLLDGKQAPPLPEQPVPCCEHVIVAGLGVGGTTVVRALEAAQVPSLLVDLDPGLLSRQAALGRTVVFGDITSPEVLHFARIEEARALVLCISDLRAGHRAREVAHELRPGLPILIRTRFASEEGAERAPGVQVVSEEFAGALNLCRMLFAMLGLAGVEEVLRPIVRAHKGLAEGQEDELIEPFAGRGA